MYTPGKVEVGKKMYFILHAYHHVIGEVVEITGKRDVVLKNCVWIYRSQLDWTTFFARGYTKENTTYHNWPDGEVHYSIGAFDWNHEIVR